MTRTSSAHQDMDVARLWRWVIALVLVANGIGAIFSVLRLGFGHDDVFGLSRKFDPRFEANVPTWLNTILLFACAQFLFLIWARIRREKGPFAMNWLILAIGFAYLSLDEAAELHELLSNLIPKHLGGVALGSKAWVIFGSVGVAVLGYSFWSFLRHLEPRVRRNCIIAGAMYVGGAIAMDAVGGLWLSAGRTHTQDGVYMALSTIEETLEMLGAGFFAVLTLQYFIALSKSSAVTDSPISLGPRAA